MNVLGCGYKKLQALRLLLLSMLSYDRCFVVKNNFKQLGVQYARNYHSYVKKE